MVSGPFEIFKSGYPHEIGEDAAGQGCAVFTHHVSIETDQAPPLDVLPQGDESILEYLCRLFFSNKEHAAVFTPKIIGTIGVEFILRQPHAGTHIGHQTCLPQPFVAVHPGHHLHHLRKSDIRCWSLYSPVITGV